MSNLKLKVCGMKIPDNISGVQKLRPDFMGFIFYSKSPRYINGLDAQEVRTLPGAIQKVGVFVNESIEFVQSAYETYDLDYVQLHGDEDVSYLKSLQVSGVKTIKVFRVKDQLPETLESFSGVSDMFLFDTATKNYGGSGQHFDWKILSGYTLNVPYLLSGGIRLEDLEQIKKMELEGLIGIDVNSQFELDPGIKDLEKLENLKNQL